MGFINPIRTSHQLFHLLGKVVHSGILTEEFERLLQVQVKIIVEVFHNTHPEQDSSDIELSDQEKDLCRKLQNWLISQVPIDSGLAAGFSDPTFTISTR